MTPAEKLVKTAAALVAAGSVTWTDLIGALIDAAADDITALAAGR